MRLVADGVDITADGNNISLGEVNNVMIDFAIDYGVEDVALELICRYNHVQWFL